MLGFSGQTVPFHGLPVDVLEGGVLQRDSGEVFDAEEGVVNLVLHVGEGVDDEVVIVGIEVANAARHFDLLFGGLGVFLAEIPVEGEVVSEAGHDFPAVKFALGAEVSAIERG